MSQTQSTQPMRWRLSLSDVTDTVDTATEVETEPQ